MGRRLGIDPPCSRAGHTPGGSLLLTSRCFSGELGYNSSVHKAAGPVNKEITEVEVLYA
jgi:hypothetical protein